MGEELLRCRWWGKIRKRGVGEVPSTQGKDVWKPAIRSSSEQMLMRLIDCLDHD
jgi:hypothetical protein